MKSKYYKEKPQVTMASKSCRKGNAEAFRNIMELAHNICSSPVERNRNLKDKIKDFEESSRSMDFGCFLVRKYYLIGPE